MSEGKPGRNDKCPCGSGRKYKQCCLAKDEEAARVARAKAAEEAAAAEVHAEPTGHPVYPVQGHANAQPWKRGTNINTHGFRKTTGARKVGSG